MFQTEPILFLQQLVSEPMSLAMTAATELGRMRATLPLMIAIIVAIHFRFGMIILHATLASKVLTNLLKDLFALPRPVNVDSNVEVFGGHPAEPTPFTSRGADGPFSALPDDVVDHFRSHRVDSFGFPSGHASDAMAMWGSIGLYLRRPLVRLFAGGMILATVLSRLYFGRHFLADVIGGLLLGLIALLGYRQALRSQRLRQLLFERRLQLGCNLQTAAVVGYLLLFPLIFLLGPESYPKWGGAVLGLNLGFLLFWCRGLPPESGSRRRRALRLLLALAIYFTLDAGLGRLATGLGGGWPLALAHGSLMSFGSLWGSVVISRRRGLYRDD